VTCALHGFVTQYWSDRSQTEAPFARRLDRLHSTLVRHGEYILYLETNLDLTGPLVAGQEVQIRKTPSICMIPLLALFLIS